MLRSSLLTVSGVLVASSSAAHHGFGSFDPNSEVEISGIIADLDFINPHSWLYLDVQQSDGTVARFHCELRPATALRRAGWTPEMFVVGETITVEGSPDRKDENACYASTLVFSDGTRLDRYGQLSESAGATVTAGANASQTPDGSSEMPRLANGDPDISGDWAPEQPVMTDPRGLSGAFVPLSVARTAEPGEVPEGFRALQGYRNFVSPLEDMLYMLRILLRADTTNDPTGNIELTKFGEAAAREALTSKYSRCDSIQIIRYWALTEGLINRITQGSERITLQYGHLGFTRTVHLDMDEHPAEIEPSHTGHSIGWWENDVLTVDTIGFSAGTLWYPIRHGNRLHVVERFSLDPRTMALTREVQAEDPDHLIGSYRFRDIVYPSETPFVLDSCDELPSAGD